MKRIGNLLHKVETVFQLYRDPYVREFVLHNKQVWINRKNHGTNKEILVPISGSPRAIVTWAYFANVFAEKFCASILSYGYKKLGIGGYQRNKICQSYGCGQYVFVSISSDEEKKCLEQADSIFRKLTSKEELLNLDIDDIEVGLKIYDSYLRMGEPTVDLKDNRLKALIEDAVKMVFFWRKYFATHAVKVLITNSEHYMEAIVGSVAAASGVNVYAIGMGYGVKLSEHFAWNGNFKYYPKLYRQLPKELQTEGIQWACEQLKRRLDGEVGVDMEYAQKSAFAKTLNPSTRVLSETNAIKILIAPHDFYDSPHGYGEKHLFPDFYEWLCHIGEISQNTSYEWYIKVHPDESDQTINVIKMLIDKYPKFQWVEKDVSHQQLIQEGIQFVLTVYGTVGCEYPLFGIPVINAGYNPHIAYGFNLSPKTIQEYDNILYHLDDVQLDYSKEEIYEFYFMHHLFGLIGSPYRCWDNLIVPSINRFGKMTDGRKHSSIVYHCFIQNYTEEWHMNTIANVKEYIRFADEYTFDSIHLDEKCLQRIYERMED